MKYVKVVGGIEIQAGVKPLLKSFLIMLMEGNYLGIHTGTRYDPGNSTTLYWYKVSKWHTQNDIHIDTNIWKYVSANPKRPVYSNKRRTFH